MKWLVLLLVWSIFVGFAVICLLPIALFVWFVVELSGG